MPRRLRQVYDAQWQKSALSRAFMRTESDILVLDEPTAAMDAAAEAAIFEHFSALTKDRIAILVSHRFSTVRVADQAEPPDGNQRAVRATKLEMTAATRSGISSWG